MFVRQYDGVERRCEDGHAAVFERTREIPCKRFVASAGGVYPRVERFCDPELLPCKRSACLEGAAREDPGTDFAEYRRTAEERINPVLVHVVEGNPVEVALPFEGEFSERTAVDRAVVERPVEQHEISHPVPVDEVPAEGACQDVAHRGLMRGESPEAHDAVDGGGDPRFAERSGVLMERPVPPLSVHRHRESFHKPGAQACTDDGEPEGGGSGMDKLVLE